MAFDQVSLCLYPPRWACQSTSDPRLKHVSGNPVQMIADVRSGLEAPALRLAELRPWFASRGFDCQPNGVVFLSPGIPSPLGPRPEVDISAAVQDDEVASFYCRFLITPHARPPLERWDALMAELCQAFGLKIGIADGEFVGPEAFRDIIRDSGIWRGLSSRLEWDEPKEHSQT